MFYRQHNDWRLSLVFVVVNCLYTVPKEKILVLRIMTDERGCAEPHFLPFPPSSATTKFRIFPRQEDSTTPDNAWWQKTPPPNALCVRDGTNAFPCPDGRPWCGGGYAVIDENWSLFGVFSFGTDHSPSFPCYFNYQLCIIIKTSLFLL